MRTFRMLVRRELWEHRMLWITPAIIAGLLLLGVSAFGVVHGGYTRIDAVVEGGAAPLTADVFGMVTLAMSLPFYLAAITLAIIYLADCLYAERRDRSILFWKSLPVSDRETVLAKLFTGLVLVPAGCFVAAMLTGLGASAALAARAGLGLVGGVPVWDTAAWLHAKGLELYALIVLVLWYAPHASYLLLASAWAKRSVYAWAIIPPVLLAMLERTVFGTHHVWGLIRRSPSFDPATLLSSAQLWIGLALAALMVWAAITLRRRATEV